MRRKTFLIPSLILAGFAPVGAVSAREDEGIHSDTASDEVAKSASLFRQDRRILLAGHRSHQSHRSHSSHRSSASGGGYYPPATIYAAPPPPPPPVRSRPQTLYSQPLVIPKTAETEDPFKEIVRQVQKGLTAFGYYDGPPDGFIGPETKSALLRFQSDSGLKVTGTITPEVLGAFGIKF